jgi:hypothetical protein
MGLMSFSRPIRMYHSHSDLIWPDHTLKKLKTKIIFMYCTLKHSLLCYLNSCYVVTDCPTLRKLQQFCLQLSWLLSRRKHLNSDNVLVRYFTGKILTYYHTIRPSLNLNILFNLL